MTQLGIVELPIYAYFIKYVNISSSQWHLKNYYLTQVITHSEPLSGKSDRLRDIPVHTRPLC